MRQTFPFHQLGDDEFEALIGHICMHVLGTGTILFAPGKDGGRDATFSGTAQKFPSEKKSLTGQFIIQAKWTSNPVASCSDPEFEKLLNGEKPKIIKLIAAKELEHYLVFTNRKRTAIKGTALQKQLKALNLKTAHILGIENLTNWMIMHPTIWPTLGFDRFDKHLKIQTEDLKDIVMAFHQTIKAGTATPVEHFPYKPKPEKNKIHNLSKAYFDFINRDSLPFFSEIEGFLKNPRNDEFRALYEDTAHEIKGKIIAQASHYGTFDEVLTDIAQLVTSQNSILRGKRKFVLIFLHYMYYTCDIGQSE